MTDEQTTYEYRDVPALPGESRWSVLDRTAAGWGVSGPGELLAHAAGTLADERIAEFRDYRPEPVAVALKAVASTEAGYVLVGRGEVSGYPEFEPRRPSKIWKKVAGPDLFDDFLLGGAAFREARDAEVWEALRAVAERYRVTGRDLRVLNDHVAVLVALRAGLRCDASRLPNIDPPAVFVAGGEE